MIEAVSCYQLPESITKELRIEIDELVDRYTMAHDLQRLKTDENGTQRIGRRIRG